MFETLLVLSLVELVIFSKSEVCWPYAMLGIRIPNEKCYKKENVVPGSIICCVEIFFSGAFCCKKSFDQSEP